jgi:hypothetical protein
MQAMAQKNAPVSGNIFYSKSKIHHNTILNSTSLLHPVEWYRVHGIQAIQEKWWFG